MLGSLGISVLRPLGQFLIPMLRAPSPTLVLQLISRMETKAGGAHHTHIREGIVAVIRVTTRMIGWVRVVAETLFRVGAPPDMQARVGSDKGDWRSEMDSSYAIMKQLLL